MKRVLTAVVLVPVVLAAVFWAPLWLLGIFCAAVAILALAEYFKLEAGQGLSPLRAAGYAFCVIAFALLIVVNVPLGFYSDASVAVMAILLILSPFLFLAFALSQTDLRNGIHSAAMSWIGCFYVTLPLACIFLLRLGRREFWILLIFLLTWCGDIAAFYVGRAVGRHKLAPTISPGKSWEGAVASVCTAVVVGLVMVHYAEAISSGVSRLNHQGYEIVTMGWGRTIIFAVLTNVAAQVGDLVESALKRAAGVKDSGTLLPGHGGVLDRVDALLFSLPVGYVLIGLLS